MSFPRTLRAVPPEYASRAVAAGNSIGEPLAKHAPGWTVERLLRADVGRSDWFYVGNGGQPMIRRERLGDLVAALRRAKQFQVGATITT